MYIYIIIGGRFVGYRGVKQIKKEILVSKNIYNGVSIRKRYQT